MSTTVVDAEFRARLTQVIHSFGSVVAAATAVGVSDNAIYKWLSGRGQPSAANLVALARAKRVSVEWLATGAEAAQSAQAITRAVEHGDSGRKYDSPSIDLAPTSRPASPDVMRSRIEPTT